jgi:hypothetical protein
MMIANETIEIPSKSGIDTNTRLKTNKRRSTAVIQA